MLLWEALAKPVKSDEAGAPAASQKLLRTHRLPYDTRCAAITKTGKRCKGRIRQGTDFCPFHDPRLSAQRRRENAAKGGHRRRRLSHIPGGYLRKLSSRRAVGEAMNRLYRELRLGLVTTEMAGVLFAILTRLLDSGLCEEGVAPVRRSGRCKVDRFRPKISDLLTRSERIAWRRAVANAPSAFVREGPATKPAAQPPQLRPRRKQAAAVEPARIPAAALPAV